MKLYVATADDHDYDVMSQWVVGVFTTEELAKLAIEQDKAIYVASNHPYSKAERYNWYITEVELDEVLING